MISIQASSGTGSSGNDVGRFSNNNSGVFQARGPYRRDHHIDKISLAVLN